MLIAPPAASRSAAVSRAAWASTTSPSGDHEPGLLRHPDEHVRRHVDAVGAPAGQRLDAGDPAGRRADHGLVDQRDVAGRHRVAQGLDELEPLQPGPADRRLVLDELVLAAVLGLVHRQVGVAEHALRVLVAVAVRDPDAGAELDVVPGDVHALLERARGSARRPNRPPAAARPRTARRTRRRPAAPRCRGAARRQASRPATSIRTASPAAWPKRSLTGLKPSRSTNSSATGCRGDARASARARPGRARPAVGQVGEQVVPRQVDHVLGQPRAGRRRPRRPPPSRPSACWSAVSVERARCSPGATIQCSWWPSRSWAPISWARGGASRTSTARSAAAGARRR